ncbi:hypothetical protein BY458DRAFT_506685 [Sporodiniella umbellata]|nr:hypothetical protein BY458DRAFT_506685 [Sporodiniella umbellata]
MSNLQPFTFYNPNPTQNEIEEPKYNFRNSEGAHDIATSQDPQPVTDLNPHPEVQETRRLEALEMQKTQKNDLVDSLRQMDLFGNNDDGHSTLKRARDDSDEEMESAIKLSKHSTPKLKKKLPKKNIYADQIMYAEYLESIPGDFAEEWLSVVCPKGKRCFVTSGRGQTIARTRGGKMINRFQSILPNGSSDYIGTEYTILDCVYNPVNWTFYVLDLMCWRGYSVADCDTSFRSFWLHTKFDSNDLDCANSENRFYKFIPLNFTATSEVLAIANNPEGYLNDFQKKMYGAEVDGLLFYHKQAHYVGGSTPLVCWVPCDRIPELVSYL